MTKTILAAFLRHGV